MNDAESDLDSTDHDFVSPMLASPTQNLDRDHTNRNAVVSRSLFIEEDDAEDHLQREEQVLTDAVMAMLNNYTNLSVEAITSGFVYTVDLLTPYIMGSGALVATAAAGLAGIGSWSDNRHSRGTISRLSWIPSNRALWTTAFIGGLSAGGIFLFRSGVRRMVIRGLKYKNSNAEKDKKKSY